uniref:Uncharacterized protein n=1 Tax=Mastacembelus armatus TaxID=205130 RepID=A0A7N8YR95_9TELE
MSGNFACTLFASDNSKIFDHFLLVRLRERFETLAEILWLETICLNILSKQQIMLNCHLTLIKRFIFIDIQILFIGATHLNRCPVQPYIPIYLIVMGVSSLLSLSLTYIRSSWKEGVVYILILSHLLCLFLVGSAWIYSTYPPTYSPETDQYCHKTTYQFAFVVTTLVWITVTLIFVCGGCFALLTCCKAVSARRRLIPNRTTFYGGIGDSEEPTAGDV